eukprot:Skav201120  [mRNA]  locus=scaffold185:476810:491022:- [translate_table: standard]
MGTACCSQAEQGQKEQLAGGNPPVEASKSKAAPSPGAPAAPAPVVASDGDGYNYKVFPDGSRYEGQWKDGLKHGKGRFIYPDGDVYDGEWQDGKAHGHGTYTSKQSKYVGDWQSDLKHGQAVEEWDDTSKYTGTYSHGQKHGKGRFEWPDGSVYDGEFRNNNVEGEGTFTWKDGRQYKGQWVDNSNIKSHWCNGTSPPTIGQPKSALSSISLCNFELRSSLSWDFYGGVSKELHCLVYSFVFSLHHTIIVVFCTSYGTKVTMTKHDKSLDKWHPALQWPRCCNVALCAWMTRAECAMPAALCITELWEELLSVEDVVQVAQVGRPADACGLLKIRSLPC